MYRVIHILIPIETLITRSITEKKKKTMQTCIEKFVSCENPKTTYNDKIEKRLVFDVKCNTLD